MLPQFIDIRSKIRRFCLPQYCLLCAADSGDQPLCEACSADLPWHAGSSCPVCALPSPSGSICGACLQHPPAFDTTFAALDYRFPVDALLQRHKYGGMLGIAQAAGSLLSERTRQAPRPDVIIPMPLHAQRLRERGFNQAAEIARVVARQLDLTLDARICTRTRATPAQAGLSLQERRSNLRGAFACNKGLQGKHVVLLDDVMTTGASLDELARTARNAGAARVDCWVVARTLRQ